MSETPPGFGIFGDLFSTPEMREAFSEEAWFARMVDVEAALARAQGGLGVIPADAARIINEACANIKIDMAALKVGTENVGYPVLPLVRQIAAEAGDAGGYVHWGATTQDIMDTALVLQLRDGLDLTVLELRRLIAALMGLSHAHRDTVMAGRTHLQHALPVTFGFKCANWLSPLVRTLERIKQARPRIEQLQFAGAVGTLASLGGDAQPVREALGKELQLDVPGIGWHAARDGLAEAVSIIAILSGLCAKIATDVILLMQTEVGEAFEPYAHGRGGSSTMPQKRNPMAAEYVLAAGRNIQAQVPVLMAALAGDHERATGPWHAEWTALPQVFLLGAGALTRTVDIVEGLEVHPERMAANLAATGGLIMAEPVMMALGPHLGRQMAHDVVEDACRKAITEEKIFAECLAADSRISDHLDAADIETLLNPARYTGLAGEFTDNVVAAAQAALES
ncbi:MAG: 3-carboxy-cis,cis-muconate cycloisomerase [Hyphomicrobiales bacterium]